MRTICVQFQPARAPRLSPRQVTMLYMRAVLTCPGVWEFSYQRARRHDWINYYFSARDVRSLWTFLHSAVLAPLPAAAPFRSGGTARSTAPGEALCSATRREAATLAFFRQRASGVRGIWSPELAVELAPGRVRSSSRQADRRPGGPQLRGSKFRWPTVPTARHDGWNGVQAPPRGSQLAPVRVKWAHPSAGSPQLRGKRSGAGRW